MSVRFQVGDRVAWPRRSRTRIDLKHVGTVVAVVQDGTTPWEAHFCAEHVCSLLPRKTAWLTRPDESYVVLEPGATTLSRGKLYWPRVSQLRLFDGRGCEK